MTEGEFLHLASGPTPGDVVREALRRLGRDEAVLNVIDGIAEGPLADVDSGAAMRAAWWERLQGEPLSDAEARELDDRELWQNVRTANSKVVVWHGPIHVDRLLRMRACWYLRDQPDRLHEVALPPCASPHLAAFYGAVGIAGPDVAAAHWKSVARIADVAGLARAWVELRDEPGEWLRVLEGDAIVVRPLTAYDCELVRATGADWTASDRVVGRVLADFPVSYELLVWRIRALLQSGVLAARGELNRMKLPMEIRVRQASGLGVG